MKPAIALWIAGMLAVSGAAAYCQAVRDVDAAIVLYKSAPLCCRAPNAMTFSPLKSGIETSSLDEKSPAFVFEPSGKSYFGAFALPSGISLQVHVRSLVFRTPSQGLAIFFPRIMLLDRSKAIITTVNWADDKILHSGEPGGPDYIETLADLSAFPSARFMIVYTDGGRIGAMEKLQHVRPESSVMTPVTGVASHVFFVEVPDPHLDQDLTTPVLRAPIAPGSLVIDIHIP
jgi:hypothetical protein